MLVFTTQTGDEVILGDVNAPLGTVHVSDIRKGRARIGFAFPKSIEVNRRKVASSKRASADAARSSKRSASTFGDDLRHHLDRDGRTTDELARAAGLCVERVQRIRAGEDRLSQHEIDCLYRALDLTLVRRRAPTCRHG